MKLPNEAGEGRATRRRAAVRTVAVAVMLVGCPMLASCAKVIGAEFSDLLPFPPGGGGAGGGADRVPADASEDDVDAPLGDADVAVVDGDFGDGAPSDERSSSGPEAGADARDAVADPGSTAEPELEAGPRDARSDAPAEDATPGDAGSLGDAAGVGLVVLNEINALGSLDDFIELYNPASAPLDLGGYALAQAEQAYGPPNYASRLIFAAGTTLAAGERLLIVANQTVRGGPFTPCEVPRFTTSACYTVEWGIARAGERVYLLGPDLTPVDTADFPTVDAGQPESGRSWGRFPDGTGPFQSTAYSPAAVNRLQ